MQGHGRDGGFDTLRLAAALIVFHSHSFIAAGRPEPWLPGFSWGVTAVIAFFTMSGYWVSRSALRRSLAAFAAARFLRIVPGLLVCCLVTIGICALATSEVVNDYFRERATWRFLGNALPLFVLQQQVLPHVFEDGYNHTADGSMWTLPYEVFCYLLAAMAAVFGPRGLRLTMAGVAIFAAVMLFDPGASGVLRVVTILDRRMTAVFCAAFFLGAALDGVDDRDLAKLVAVSAAVVFVARHDLPVLTLGAVALYGGLTIWAGRSLALDRHVTRGRDISYGVYLYGFPCEQLAWRFFRPEGAGEFVAYYLTALAATLGFAVLSWALVEKPALALKGRIAAMVGRGVAGLPPQAERARA
jgi:peptidoglycan/LPS O-acetylase OafA/YrhL